MDQSVKGKSEKDNRAAQDACETLLNVLPKSETGIHNIAYTYGLICRDAGIPMDQATALIMSWSERLRALPNFKELYPLYSKPSFYRYQVRYAVSSAYRRMQDKPSSCWYEALTGRKAPAASFWDNRQPPKKGKSASESRRGGKRSNPLE